MLHSMTDSFMAYAFKRHQIELLLVYLSSLFHFRSLHRRLWKDWISTLFLSSLEVTLIRGGKNASLLSMTVSYYFRLNNK